MNLLSSKEILLSSNYIYTINITNQNINNDKYQLHFLCK